MTASRSGRSEPGEPATLNMIEAIRRTILAEMERDPAVVTVSEPSPDGGFAFGAGAGLRDRFGAERCLELPASEGLLVQTAIGLALAGARPVLELSQADFALAALEPILQEAARARFRTGGEYACPLVIRVPYGGGTRGGPFFSASPEALLAHAPGLTVLVPSSPADAASLLRHAIRMNDPVVVLEPKLAYWADKQAIDPDREEDLRARLVRDGDDAVVVTWGGMVGESLRAAEESAGHGLSAAVLDLRALSPLDEAAVQDAVARSGRVVVVEEAPRTGGFGAEIAARIADRALLHLEAPVVRVAGPDAPLPFAHEHLYRPDARRISAAIEQVVDF